MPRYLIVRRFSVDESQTTFVCTVLEGDHSRTSSPEITWEHSHVVLVEPDGNVLTYRV